ncbi:uncharacterized protein [Clytia hemisphaerica]|uniref:uncharacterized protein n=1 Tax=Clytia hemisphaerica TaxID=252671 RepID=UPI0034D6137D
MTDSERLKDGHKRHACFYCGKLEHPITRHFKTYHKEEEEVKAIMKMKTGKEKRRLWIALERKGDHKFNSQSSTTKLVVRKTKNISEKVPCVYCTGLFAARSLSKHVKKCPSKKNQELKKPLAAGRMLLSSDKADGKFGDVREHIVEKMRGRDENYLIMKNDRTLLLLGYSQMQLKEKDRYCDIRYTMKTLSKLLIEFRSITGMHNATSSSLVQVKNYDNVLRAAKNLTNYEGPRKIGKPNVFRKIGFSLSNLAVVVRTEAIKACDNDLREQCRSFLELYEVDWTAFSVNAQAVYEDRSANAPQNLPLESDVKLFKQYCVDEITKMLKYDSFSKDDYSLLSNLTLARLMTFNARRGSEVARLKLDRWEGVMDDRWKKKEYIDLIDDDVERKLAEKLKLCYIEGKKKKRSKKKKNHVPILFPEECVEAIQRLVSFRDKFVDEENEYVFHSGELYIKGWNALQTVAKEIGDRLTSPKLLTPTRTRKFLATILQLMQLNDAELGWMTTHMGHTKDVHLGFYRQEDSTIELTKVAKVLCAVDQGAELKNKKIDDLLTENNVEESRTEDAEDNDIQQQREDPKKTKKTWKKWTKAETEALHKAFQHHVKSKVKPMQHEVLNALNRYPVLKERGADKVKNKISKTIDILKKKSSD